MKKIVIVLCYLMPLVLSAQVETPIDPNKSYQIKIQEFKDGKITSKEQLLALAYQAKDHNDPIANVIALKFKNVYLDPLPIDSLLNQQTGNFISLFYTRFNSKDKIIRFMNKNPQIADSLFDLKNKRSEKLTDALIAQDYIYSIILLDGESVQFDPQWNKMEKAIIADFGKKTASRVMLNAKLFWATKHERFEEAARLALEKVNKYGLDTTVAGRAFFNNMIYSTVFQKVSDNALLSEAASLMRYVNELEKYRNWTYIDTYAGLLYKAGKREDALKAEAIALEVAKSQKNENDIQFCTNMIERMKKGEEIWK